MSDNLKAGTASTTEAKKPEQSQGTQVSNAQLSAQSVTQTIANDTALYRVNLVCSIRRKNNITPLPGQDPNELVWKIGASLDPRTRNNLKGISGELENIFMPSIVGYGYNAPEFRRAVDEYWSTVSKIVPPDEPFLKDYEKGVPFNISLDIVGKTRKDKLNSLSCIEDKINYINQLLVDGIRNNITTPYVFISSDSIPDYLLLCYCLKYSRVANKVEYIQNSPKILFYIFEKDLAVKAQLASIDLRKQAMAAYEDVLTNETLADAILLAFDEDITKFDTSIDKAVRIDELYNTSTENMNKFVKLASDSAWEVKAIIRKALSKNKLKKHPNSEAIYYNDTLLGTDLESTSNFLSNTDKGTEYLKSLKQEIELK